MIIKLKLKLKLQSSRRPSLSSSASSLDLATTLTLTLTLTLPEAYIRIYVYRYPLGPRSPACAGGRRSRGTRNPDSNVQARSIPELHPRRTDEPDVALPCCLPACPALS